MGWDLFAWSFAVIRKNKRLLLFPILSAAVALAALFLGSRRFLHIDNLGAQDYLWLAAGYFLVSFSMIFFNCGLAACANAQFKGDEPTLGYGLRHASARLAPILVWTLLSASVGLILNAIVNRFSGAGKLAVWIFGFAWGMANYLVVPVLIAEDRGAFEAFQRSAQLVRNTWGDQLVAEIRFGWRSVLFLIFPCLVLGAMGANGYPFLLPVAIVYFVAAATVLSAAKEIFEVALYRYAALGETPAGWSPAMRTRILDR
jgi:hypothetical protein